MNRVYPTKVDWWIGLVLMLSVAVLAGTAIPFFMEPLVATPIGIGVGVLCLALAAWTAAIPYTTKYELGSNELMVRAAGFWWRVPLEGIVEVFPTRNPLSSPACSLDRLRINYDRPNGKRAFVMISPKEKDDFLHVLADSAPGLVVTGDRLVHE